VLLLNVRAVASGPVATTMTPENLRRAYGAADLGEDGRAAEALWAP
jgi:hypothetical protein